MTVRITSAFDPWTYDADGDCYISDTEKDQAIADWQSGIITMSNAMAVVNLWVMGTRNPACVAPKEAFPWKWVAIGSGVLVLIAVLLKRRE